MAYCNHDLHPQVPKTVVDVMLTYCHNCQVWHLYAYKHTNNGDYSYSSAVVDDQDFGPFDAPSEVREAALDALDRLFTLAGASLGSQPQLPPTLDELDYE